MLKMVLQSSCSSMEAIPARSLISPGTPARTGWLLASLRTTSSRYGRWLRTSTMTKMICQLAMSRQKLLEATHHKRNLNSYRLLVLLDRNPARRRILTE
ncbi:Histone-binding protein MSI1 [Zea mays]|uniref:Histone-binding protein MSI1 n=1 Tax=Zea mays TaxID=4577 RepID=A0A1D6KX83_MAIZE|nr:Histone-binding protein MSI1 [Zea mays]